MNDTDFPRLSRPVHPMTYFVSDALDVHGLLDAFTNRQAYQQNDSIGWINRAERRETQEKRLHQMLGELRRGNGYMKIHSRSSGDSK
jgi:hypothetical protein